MCIRIYVYMYTLKSTCLQLPVRDHRSIKGDVFHRSQCGAQASHVAGGISLPCCHSTTVLRIFLWTGRGPSIVDIRDINTIQPFVLIRDRVGKFLSEV